MIFLNQPRDFRLRDLATNIPLGRINQELRHAQMIDILQADGDAPIARSPPDLWVGVVFELGKDPHCGFRRTYCFILPSHTQALLSLSNDMRKAPLLECSIPEYRGRSRNLLRVAQSPFQQQYHAIPVVFHPLLTPSSRRGGFRMGRFDTALHAYIIPKYLTVRPFDSIVIEGLLSICEVQKQMQDSLAVSP